MMQYDYDIARRLFAMLFGPSICTRFKHSSKVSDKSCESHRRFSWFDTTSPSLESR